MKVIGDVEDCDDGVAVDHDNVRECDDDADNAWPCQWWWWWCEDVDDNDDDDNNVMMMLTMPGNVDDWPSVSSSATYWGQRARNAVRTGTTSTLNWSRYGQSWWWLSLLSLLRPETPFVWEPLPPWIGPSRFEFLWIGLDWLTTYLNVALCTRATSNS